MTRPNADDLAFLWDMLDAAREVERFTSGLTYQAYLDELKTVRAVERALEILGEAAKGVSASFRNNHPELDWRAIVGLRNVLAHAYGDIVQEHIWDVVENHIPKVIAALSAILPESRQ